MITVATWNVLHRVHAENWYEDVATRWPDEAERIAAISTRVAQRTEQIIALQEVSGDQLTSLRHAMPDRAFHTLRYPRVPRSRRGPTALNDRAEYLVLVTDGPGRENTAEAFEQDHGKGALVVETAGFTVIATHVTGDSRHSAEMGRLREFAEASAGPIVLLGDFNADRGVVADHLGPEFLVAPLPSDGLPTRPRTSGSKSMFIDHVVVRGAVASGVTVDSADGLSDHNPVRAALSPIGA
ncbi:endonuclease/exonuclease/phosphatase family protein [Nocardia sp. NPDC005366]|uniref:endonuclease/exonuclease/phosphatase family protein n=1 Tax=Nocardia sp. NPDC005366 TaxID=3156878 RepID=UPI0033AA981E